MRNFNQIMSLETMPTIQNEAVIETPSSSPPHHIISMESNSKHEVAETTVYSPNQDDIQHEENDSYSRNQENSQRAENDSYPTHSSQGTLHDEENQIASNTSASESEDTMPSNNITEVENAESNQESVISSYSSEGIKQIIFTLIQDHSRQTQLGRRLLNVKRSAMLVVALAVIFVNFYILLHARWN